MFLRPTRTLLASALLAVPGCTAENDRPGKDDPEDSVSTDDSVSGGDSATIACSDTTALTATILSPANGQVAIEGDVVTLSGLGTSPNSAAEALSYSWSWQGATVGIGAESTFVAAPVGSGSLTLVVTDACQKTASASVGFTVSAPAAEGVVVYGDSAGVPVTNWYGLSVAPDGTVWAAAASGLIHLDPVGATTRIYGIADGLLSDSPRAVLAHSDGTIWAGHYADINRQGEQVSVTADGTLTVLQNIDFTESEEITAVFRMKEQKYGAGAGDVWMGTNEGLCLYDTDLGVFAEHAHPTHPHSYSYGVAFSDDGNVWNGDAYQVSRWNYSNDGDLSPSADLVEYWVPWPVDVEIPISIVDADVDQTTLWLASSLYGVARIGMGATAGSSVTEVLADPFPTAALAIAGEGNGIVWIGTDDGLYRYDSGTTAMTTYRDGWLPSNSIKQIAIDRTTAPATVWLATTAGLVKIVGEPAPES